MFHILPILIVLAAGQLGDARKFVISNQCKAPVWAAYMRESGGAATVPGKSGGMWLQASGQKHEVEVPEDFAHGRFWAATGCNAQGTGCKVGGCPNGVCDGSTVGTSGATLAEFTLTGTETFDISITDGFNVPIAITPTGGAGGDGKCVKVSCGATIDLLTQCDPALAFPYGSDDVWSCFNPCTAGVQYKAGAIEPFNFKTAKSCCPETNKATCDPLTDVPFYKQLKASCTDGFVYPPETEMNHECKGPEYLIEFCPGGKGIGADPSGNAPVNQCAGGAIVGGGATGTNSNGGGSFAGLPAGAGESCDGSTASSQDAGASEVDSSETALTGGIPGAGTAVGIGASASGSSIKAATTHVAATASTEADTGSLESPVPVNDSAPAVSTAASISSLAAVTPSPVSASAVAPDSAAPAATSPPCRGRHCRSGHRDRGNEARKLAKAVAERDGECAARV